MCASPSAESIEMVFSEHFYGDKVRFTAFLTAKTAGAVARVYHPGTVDPNPIRFVSVDLKAGIRLADLN